MALPYIKINYTSDIGTQYYIRLLDFLAFLELKVIPKVYINEADLTGVPLVKFDLNVEQNLIYIEPEQVSANPKICFVNKSIALPYLDKNILKTFKYTDSEGYSDATPFSINIDNVEYGQIMNIYVNSVFIIDTIKLNSNRITGDLNLYDFLKKILSGISSALGGLNNLDLLIDETTNEIKIIDKNPLPNKDKLLKRFNVPNIEPAIFSLYGYTNQSSFISEFNFKSELTKEYAMAVTTAAQQKGTVVGEGSMPLASINVGTTDRYKFKIINDVKLEEELQKNTNLIETLNKSWAEYKEFLSRLENLTVTNSDLTAFKTKLRDLINISLSLRGKLQKEIESNLVIDSNNGNVKKIITPPVIIQPDPKWVVSPSSTLIRSPLAVATGNPTPIPSSNNYNPPQIINNDKITSNIFKELGGRNRAYIFSGFLPLNLQLTMDGLSGMKIGQTYSVNDNFLPLTYPDVLEFLIKNIKHDISNQKWTTQLESFAISQTENVKENIKPVAFFSKPKAELDEFKDLAFYFEHDMPLFKEPTIKKYEEYYNEYIVDSNIEKYKNENKNIKTFFTDFVINNFEKYSKGNNSFIEKAHQMLSTNKGLITLKLIGSTSWIGEKEYNFKLSQRRIQSVKLWLESTKLNPFIQQGTLKIEEKPIGVALTIPKNEKETYGIVINCNTPVKDKNNKLAPIYSVNAIACRRVKIEIDFKPK